MKKILLYSVALTAALAVALGATACVSRAKDGEGSTAASGEVRDPADILPVNEAAPEFAVSDEKGVTHRLSDYAGKKNVVLIFYPGNETPGCTSQLCSARDDWKKYESSETIVFGVNPAGRDSHASFSKNHSFPFPLLADTDGKMVRDYGCRGIAGVVKRTVYVIDKSGKIVFAERGMPDTDTILAALKTE